MVPRARQFRRALETAGDLFVAYGRFLSGRTDLLPAEHAGELAALPMPRLLRPRLRADDLDFPVETLEPVGHSYLSTRYLAVTDEGTVLLEAFGAAESLPSGDFRRLRSGLAGFARGPEVDACGPDRIEEFRDWLRAHADVARRRETLAALDGARDGRKLALPRPSHLPVPSQVIGYVPVAGRPITASDAVADDAAHVDVDPEVVVESLLELVLLYGVVPLELCLETWVRRDDGRVGPCFALPLEAIPRHRLQAVTQYVCALIADDLDRGVRAARRTLPDVLGSVDLRRRALAAQADLRLRRHLPRTAASTEGMWRAMSCARPLPPYFRELHRSIITIGEWATGDDDPFAAPIWSVLGSLGRHQAGRLADGRRASHLVLGATLSAAAGARAASSWLEALREDETPARDLRPAPESSRSAPWTWRAALLLQAAGLAALLHLALTDPTGPGTPLAIVGAVALAAAPFFQAGGGRR